MNIFLPLRFNISCGYSNFEEPSHLDGSFENPQRMIFILEGGGCKKTHGQFIFTQGEGVDLLFL